MQLFGLGPWEVALILIIALIVFGPSKLPQLARSMGEALREFKKASREISEPMKVSEDKPRAKYRSLEEMAKSLGIDTEGKTREQIVKEILEKIKEEKGGESEGGQEGA